MSHQDDKGLSEEPYMNSENDVQSLPKDSPSKPMKLPSKLEALRDELIKKGRYAVYDGGRGYDEPEAFEDGFDFASEIFLPVVLELIGQMELCLRTVKECHSCLDVGLEPTLHVLTEKLIADAKERLGL